MDILLAILGIIMIIKGSVKVGKNSRLPKNTGRFLGVLELIPTIFGFITGFMAQTAGKNLDITIGFLPLSLIIFIITALLIVVIAHKKKELIN